MVFGFMLNEADTCRKYVVPLLQAAAWDTDPHSIAEQKSFTDGRIVPRGQTARRRPGKRADYLLRSLDFDHGSGCSRFSLARR